LHLTCLETVDTIVETDAGLGEQIVHLETRIWKRASIMDGDQTVQTMKKK